jgi:DNA-binding transcriptional MerR regulator
MSEAVTISVLSKQTGISSKTLRYWEGLGLLPRAARSHTGYRLFGQEAAQYVAFVQKCKYIGLTLAEMRRLLELAESGRNPCPEVVRWAEKKLKTVEQQIRALSVLERRLRRVCRNWSKRSKCPPARCAGICCLVQGLPIIRNSRGGVRHAQIVGSTRRLTGSAGG